MKVDQSTLDEPRSVQAVAPRRNAGYQNQIRESLKTGKFLYTLEYVPDLSSAGSRSIDDLTRNAELVGKDARIAGINIGDRVKSLDSLDTVSCGLIAADASGKVPLLHLAGKDRTPAQARAVISRALSLGLENMLLLTGDGITEERAERIRYQESIVAICDAKQLAPNCLVAAAISPFKYREEELANQYLKMAKKVNVGADYLITNCGWDMRKLAELTWYRDARGLRIPLVANLLMPTFGWAKGIHSRRLPGVFMSDDLFKKISEEQAQGKVEAKRMAWHRLALQIVGAKHMDYAGVHLSGVDTYEDLCAAIETADELGRKLHSLESWQQAWTEAHRLSDGHTVDFAPAGGLYMFNSRPAPGSLSTLPKLGDAKPSEAETAKYSRMSSLHHAVFEEGTAGASVMSLTVRAMDKTELGRAALLKLEKSTKQAALGCETCGFCRVEYLLYNCPETCPKGLANGPCAGTDENTCEFKDRECIHNQKYRLAKAQGRLEELERTVIPSVEGTRGTSSWVNHFKGNTPKVRR